MGHALAPKMGGEDGEDFADAFAQALLFPEAEITKLRKRLAQFTDIGSKINTIKSQAKKLLISPLTIRMAIEAHETARGLEHIKIGTINNFMGATTNFSKNYKTLTDILFDVIPPCPAEYKLIGRMAFDSQFFEGLAGFCSAETGAEHFIHEVLGLSLPDSAALAEELRA